MSGAHTVIRVGLVAVVLAFVEVGPVEGQTSEPPNRDRFELAAPVELFPARLVASQIRAALADPRNAAHLDEAERLVAEATEPVPNTITIEPEPSLEAVTPLAARIRDSRTRIAELATQAREALPVGPSATALAASWVPWAAVGVLLLLFFLTRALSKPTEHRSLRTARKLARRGIVAGEVARRTGLSQDVIHLIKQRSKRREPREVA